MMMTIPYETDYYIGMLGKILRKEFRLKKNQPRNRLCAFLDFVSAFSLCDIQKHVTKRLHYPTVVVDSVQYVVHYAFLILDSVLQSRRIILNMLCMYNVKSYMYVNVLKLSLLHLDQRNETIASHLINMQVASK